MTARLRFGVLGTGNIARQFADGVFGARRAVVEAVASRAQDRADSFGERFAVARRYGDYEQLLHDDAIDAVYIALPNAMHHAWTLRCLAAGKHVLCEKPLAVDATQAQQMFDAAERAGRVLMEAFMYRCHPQTHAVVEKVRSGAIGRLKLIRTAFCFRVRQTEGNIRFDASLAGGALMDIGCYCVSFMRLLAGTEPQAMHAAGRLHPSGVDEYAAGVLTFPGDMLGEFCCGMSVQTNNAALVCGDEGYLEIPWPWKPVPGPDDDNRVSFALNTQIPPRQDGQHQVRQPHEIFSVPVDRPLYALEADAFAQTVLDGRPAPVTRADSVGNMHVLDELRRQVGVRW